MRRGAVESLLAMRISTARMQRRPQPQHIGELEAYQHSALHILAAMARCRCCPPYPDVCKSQAAPGPAQLERAPFRTRCFSERTEHPALAVAGRCAPRRRSMGYLVAAKRGPAS